MAQLDIRPVKGNINANEIVPGGNSVWIDFNFGVNSLSRGASAPDVINLGATDIETLGFDGINTTEEVSVVLELNHNWKEGTVIRPHLHWYATTTAVGNVNWQLDYVFSVTGVALTPLVTINVITATPGTAWLPLFSSFPQIAGTGYKIGTQLHMRLFRDPTDNDTYGADAALATFGLHVEIDTLGSRGISTK